VLKFKLILEAIDRVSAPARRVKAAVADMTRGTKQLAAAERAGYATGLRLRAGLSQFASTVRRAGAAARSAAGRAGLAAWTKATELAKRGTGALIGKVGGLIGGMAKWGLAAGTAAGGFALFDLFSTAAKFEQYQIMLENMEGSNAAAKKSFSWVQEYAKTTPYELADVMEAFVQLKAYGIDPMNGSLTALGDASAGMSKPLMQSVEAMADAITGEYERLKEFGIRASKQGDQVTFSWRKNGKDLSRTVKASGAEIEGTLKAIFSDRFGGMMARQSQTFAGMISNLKDSWSAFLMLIADAGIFDLVKSKIGQLLAWVNKLAQNGQLKQWARQISDWLEKAFNWAVKFIEETDWQQVGSDIRTVGTALLAVAKAINWIVQLGPQLKQALTLPSLPTMPAWLSGFGGFTSGAGIQMGTAMKRGFPALAPARPQAPAPQFPLRAAPVTPPRFPYRGAANDTQVGGLIRLQVEAKPGTSVRTTGIEGSNARVPLRVDIGRSMAGAA
jgi:phage tail tape-measure protein